MTRANDISVREAQVDHLAAGGGVVRALDAVSLAVEGGTSLAVMGRSGCGKSTLLGLLAGLAVPTSGTVTIGDCEISHLPERERVRFRRAELGMVYQADNLLPHLTVEENVGLQLAISRPTALSAADADVDGLLGRLGLGDLTQRFPDQLSGGQRQRVAVARAIVHRPALILADEPTGALDQDSAHDVIELLVELHREIGATFVLVTHDPWIASYADRGLELLAPASSQEPAHVG